MNEETLNLNCIKTELQNLKDSNSKIIYLYNIVSFMFNLLKEKNLLVKHWRERAETLGDNILIEKDKEIALLKEQLQKSNTSLVQAKATEKLLLEKLACSLKKVEETVSALKQENQLVKLSFNTNEWQTRVDILVDNPTTTISPRISIQELGEDNNEDLCSQITYKHHTGYNQYGAGLRH